MTAAADSQASFCHGPAGKSYRRTGKRGPTAPRSAPAGAVTAQRHAGAGGARYQPLALVDDVAFDQTHNFAGPDDFRLGTKLPVPHRAEKVDLELQCREGLAVAQSAL